MTKQQVLEYGEKLRFEPWSGNSDHPCYMDAFKDAVELLWPMVEALNAIKETEGMTLLSDCCVDKTCISAYDHEGKKVAHCQHQWGVARGYDENAARAIEALSSLKQKIEEK